MEPDDQASQRLQQLAILDTLEHEHWEAAVAGDRESIYVIRMTFARRAELLGVHCGA